MTFDVFHRRRTILIVVLIVASLMYWLHASRSCSARGGILLRNAFNWPVCVEMARRLK